MRIDRDPALIAYQAADECRALVAATAKPATYPLDEVRAVIEGLQLACTQLPVAVEQASAGLRALEEQGVCGDASTALRALLNARQALAAARGELRIAESATARLGVE